MIHELYITGGQALVIICHWFVGEI